MDDESDADRYVADHRAPVNSEIFQIQGYSPIAYEELYRQEDKVFKSFKLNTFGTISEDFKIRSVRFTDVSRLGFGLEVDDFSVRMNEVYDSMIICDEGDHPSEADRKICAYPGENDPVRL
ncbi:hypothetical protein [Paenibacillus silviterrae]|uniref:hypothetical protein n=1 Tax=Paenibacillus silviterrae TaxID=3242194 RepID=UPI0025437D21|nr:hypothetical protein [Paenibacillus chinjuensis]